MAIPEILRTGFRLTWQAMLAAFAGLVATIVICVWFVDMDMLLMFYLVGMLVGAIAAIGIGQYVRRRDRETGRH